MRLREYFYGREEEQDDDEDDLIKKKVKKSNWTPAEGRNRWLDQYLVEVKNDIMNGLKRDFRMNITKLEERALKTLMNDNSIVIRPADKGSGIVIMDSDAYKSDIEKELMENETYELIPEPAVKKIERDIKKTVNEMHKRGVITNNMKKYLLPKEPRRGRVQANPKMHKTGNPQRLIINGRHTATENMAEVVENELSTHVKSMTSYIKDTTDFLNKIENIQQPVSHQAIMFCLDVRALYPSVPRDEARIAIEEALENRERKRIPTKDVLKMMDIVLNSNIFTFNDKTYVQKIGTAIGSKLGMTYACTYMGKWENELFQRCENRPSSYYRYIDDIWGVWNYGEEKLLEFVRIANEIHPNIKLELRYSKQTIEFLDVQISIENGHFKTDLFTKETDRHLYLHKSSNHPWKTKEAIPYGLGLRLKRICSTEESYKTRRNELKTHLTKRGYKNNELEKQLTKADALDRKELLKYNTKKSNDRVPLVLTYSDALPNVHNIVRQRITTLHNSERMREVFPAPPLIAYRRDKNIKDILVHKKHNTIFYGHSDKCDPCGKKCAMCQYVIPTDTFQGTDGQTYRVKGDNNCKTTSVIYCLVCKRCDKTIYVGQTGLSLYERMMVNLSNIRNRKQDPISEHFTNNGHSINDYKVIIIEKNYGSETARLTKESFWIKKIEDSPTGWTQHTNWFNLNW